jgi:hypothetical protein
MHPLARGLRHSPRSERLQCQPELLVQRERREWLDSSTGPLSPKKDTEDAAALLCGERNYDKEINWLNSTTRVFPVGPISSVDRCDRSADLPQNTGEASSANSTYAGEVAFPAPKEQTEQPRSDSLCLAPATQNSECHGDNDRGLGLPTGQ